MSTMIVFNAVADENRLLLNVDEDFDQVVGQLQPGGWAHVTARDKRHFVNSASVAWIEER